MASSETTDAITGADDFCGQQYYHVLVEFAFKHMDFQLAELEAVLDMNGVSLLLSKQETENTSTKDEKHCFCRMISLPNSKNNTDTCTLQHEQHRRRPFVILALPLNNAELVDSIGSILLRCTLVRSVLELWGMGENLSCCVQATKAWHGRNRNHARFQTNFADASKSWKLTIQTLGSKCNREEQEAMRAPFSFLDLPGPVRMKDPSNELVLIHEVELDKNGGALYPRKKKKKGGETLVAEARPPLACYFGRALNGARHTKGRAQLDLYNLKNRAYLGPTSMDAELSFIMTNLGQVNKSSIVLDPFVGTGSILLSCALRGAYCVGTDIDIRVLRGKSDEEGVLVNFRQYGLARPELIRSDNAIYHRHFRNHSPLYDAIVCDPPYGIRAGARKSGSRLENPRPVPNEHRHDHIASTRPYPVSDVMADLLDVAARTLVLGGRLVYIIPSFSYFDPDADLPRHECLRIVHICFQPLGAELGRRVVAMQKVQEYDASKRDGYLAATWKNGPESAEKCANIREKIIEASKKKPGYEERASFRKQKRLHTKEARKRAKLQADS